jgi:carboxypeptidase C (cathepsin A)
MKDGTVTDVRTHAQDAMTGVPGKDRDSAEQEKQPETTPAPAPPPVETQHQIEVDGRQLAYTVTTGTLPLKDDKGETEANIFFVAYTVPPEDEATPRPLTFAFNGGPGSSSIWLHMGALGPRRVHLNDDGTTPAPPYRVVDNPDTWLTDTDLVFIDPVGTGFSRATKDEHHEKFWSAQGDIESVGEFIRLYLTRYNRWSAPLFLAGESYGTYRAAGLAGHLIDKGIAFNGVILVSAVLSMLTLRMHGDRVNDLPYLLFLPSFSATAWYHQRLADDLQSRALPDLLSEVEQWVLSDYLLALAQGDLLGEDDRTRIISQLTRYTGLDERYIDRSRLRINIMRFCKELLRDRDQTVGRLDSRFTGNDLLGVTEFPEFDPSLVSPTPPFTAAFNDYVRRELGYEADVEYETLNMKVNEGWRFDPKSSSSPETAEALRKAFARNPHMHVLVACAYYDLATPYFAIVYTFNHMGLKPDARRQVHYTFYDAGHMMYIDRAERTRLKADIEGFYRTATGG